jgi:hypothetical protein
MKIRAGFVSNSSSTSFLILAADDLTEKNFLELMGVNPKSPFVAIFRELHEALLDGIEESVDLRDVDESTPVAWWLDAFKGKVSPRMTEKLQDAKRRGLKVYYGNIDSESSQAESFFCCDSFEAENEKFYINALECAW